VSRDYQAMLECAEPNARCDYARVLHLLRDYYKSLDRLSMLVHEKFGAEAAEDIDGRRLLFMFHSPFSDVVRNGHVDWGKVKFDCHGDMCSASVEGQECYAAVRIRERWYVIYRYTGAGKMPEAMLRGGIADNAQMEEAVLTGKVTRENYRGWLH
jgi:hypothetical protein